MRSNNELFTFFDVETPNKHNDKICSIGAVQTDSRGNVINRITALVNPEANFDDVCMRIHGISPIDVRAAQTLPELWESQLKRIFIESKMVAHNATFDLSVIWKSLLGYGIEIPRIDYACTMAMARRQHPELGNYKLPFVCDCFGIRMHRHHEAESDADACRSLFWAMVEEANQLPEFHEYRYVGKESHFSRNPEANLSIATKDIRLFKELSEEIIEDGIISSEEAYALLVLFDMFPEISDDPTLKPIISMLEEAFMDGCIDESESSRLIDALDHFVHPMGSDGCERNIQFEGRCFVLTGSFEHGSKESIALLIEKRGGIILKGVTKKCNYVIVGGCGNENWSMGNYGSKVKKALDWKARGVEMEILAETDLFSAL